MNVRQKQVIKKIVEGKTQTDAYAEVYGTSKEVAAANAPRMLGNDRVQNELQQALNRKGLNEDAIADTLLEMRNNRDWRAKESAVDRIAKFHGYSDDKTNLTQINIGGELGVQFEKA